MKKNKGGKATSTALNSPHATVAGTDDTSAGETTDTDVETTPGATGSTTTSTATATATSTAGANNSATAKPSPTTTADVSLSKTDSLYAKDSKSGKKYFAPDPTNAVSQYDNLLLDLDNFPISFMYNSKKYSGFKGFDLKECSFKNISGGVETSLKFRHSSINALFVLTTRVYPAEKAYEYVVNITNDSSKNTKVIGDLMFCPEFDGANPTINTLSGDSNGQYDEVTKTLSGSTVSFSATTGRPTHPAFPYYNLNRGNKGTFIAIGWPGSWKSSFTYNSSTKKTTVTAGQNSIKTYLKPGETIRTPLLACVEYGNISKDEQTNAWRHFYINDVMPKDNGKTIDTSLCTWSENKTNSVLTALQAFKKNNLDVESLWLDAGWFTGAGNDILQTGIWEIDTKKFPDKMADIKEYTEENNIDFLLWFEPEVVRVPLDRFFKYSKDFKEEWLLPCGSEYLVNIGIKECEEWMFNKISSIISSTGVDVYRQDFNVEPRDSWNSADGQNRVGITENKYVQGYLSLWDSLLKKFPGLVIDSCASGGGRNDLETLKRSVPLHYTDWFDAYHEDYLMKSKMTQTLFAWFPYFKNQTYQNSLVKNRMNYSMWTMLTANANTSAAGWKLMKQSYDEFNQIRDYYYDDYYQLTEYTKKEDRWNAWEFYDKEKASGFAQFYCTEKSTALTRTFKLKGLDASKTYQIKDFDGLVSVKATGKELMTNGIKITVPEKNYCVIALIKPV